MAINTQSFQPNIEKVDNTNIGPQLTSQNSRAANSNNELVNLFAQKKLLAQKAAQEQAANKAGNKMTLENLMKATGTSSPDAALQALFKSGRSGNISPSGDLQIGAPVNTQKDVDSAYTKLDKSANEIGKTYKKGLSRLEVGLQAVQNNNAIGMKMAAVDLAGLNEGDGQRILSTVVSMFGGNPTIVGKSEELASFFDGLQRSGKSDALKASLSQAFRQIGTTLSHNYQLDKQEFMAKAPQIAGVANLKDPEFQSKLQNYGTAVETRFKELDDKYNLKEGDKSSAPILPQGNPQTNQPSSIAGIAGNFIDKLRNGIAPQPTAPATAPMKATPPTTAPQMAQGAPISPSQGLPPQPESNPAIPPVLRSPASVVPGAAAPGMGSQQPMAPQPPSSNGVMRVKDKASGQVGNLPAGEYDPAKYDKI